MQKNCIRTRRIIYLCLLVFCLFFLPTAAHTAAGTLSGSFQVTDNVAPAAITDLSVVGQSPTAVTLSWTAPGDDGNWGTATEYDIRYSQSPITTEVQWHTASLIDDFHCY